MLLETVGVIWHLEAVLTRAVDKPGFVEIEQNVVQLLVLIATARTSATNHFNRPFQALSKNVFIRADITLSALETFCSMGYINLLTYLLTLID